MKIFFFLIILSLAPHLHSGLSDIPEGEMKDIKYFFDDLIVNHDFAYTIFGSKPMSLADMCLKMPSNLPILKHLKARFLFMKAKRSLAAWYKYRHEFAFKDFIFLDQEHDLFDCLVLVLINKQNMLNVLHQHISIFRRELGESFTPEFFLEKIEKREMSLGKATHDSDLLLGIMLGYGERNATLFQERFDLLRAISKRKENLPPNVTLNSKLDTIEAQLGDFSEFEEDPIIPPLYFLADTSHPETKTLKQKYTQDKIAIEKLMRKPSFIDKVLQRLTQ